MSDSGYTPKCYAWQPGNPDNICSVHPPDHEGDHTAYDGQTWPRRTATVPQATLDQLNDLEPQINRAVNGLRMEAIYDGRHDIADQFSRALEEYSRGLRIFRRIAVEWRNQMKGGE